MGPGHARRDAVRARLHARSFFHQPRRARKPVRGLPQHEHMGAGERERHVQAARDGVFPRRRVQGRLRRGAVRDLQRRLPRQQQAQPGRRRHGQLPAGAVRVALERQEHQGKLRALGQHRRARIRARQHRQLWRRPWPRHDLGRERGRRERRHPAHVGVPRGGRAVPPGHHGVEPGRLPPARAQRQRRVRARVLRGAQLQRVRTRVPAGAGRRGRARRVGQGRQRYRAHRARQLGPLARRAARGRARGRRRPDPAAAEQRRAAVLPERVRRRQRERLGAYRYERQRGVHLHLCNGPSQLSAEHLLQRKRCVCTATAWILTVTESFAKI